MLKAYNSVEVSLLGQGGVYPVPFPFLCEKENKRVFSKKEGVAEVPALMGGFDRILTKIGLSNLLQVAADVKKPIVIDNDVRFTAKSELAEILQAAHEDEVNIYVFLIDNQRWFDFIVSVVPNARCVFNANILVLDTHSFYYQHYSEVSQYVDKLGRPTDLLKRTGGFIKWLLKQPYSHVVFASESAHSLRKEKYDFYKTRKNHTTKAFWEQIKICDTFLKSIGLGPVKVLGYEADDVVASVTAMFPDAQITCMTNDKDMIQLYEFANYRQIKTDRTEVTRESVVEKYGIEATQFVDYQALCGDTSDNITGAKGIGPKKAAMLLRDYKSLENIYNSLPKLDVNIRRVLVESQQSVFESKDLAYLRRGLLNKFTLNDFKLDALAVSRKAKDFLAGFGISF